MALNGGGEEQDLTKGVCGIFTGRFVILSFYTHRALFNTQNRPPVHHFTQALCKCIDTEHYNQGRAQVEAANCLFSNIRA